MILVSFIREERVVKEEEKRCGARKWMPRIDRDKEGCTRRRKEVVIEKCRKQTQSCMGAFISLSLSHSSFKQSYKNPCYSILTCLACDNLLMMRRKNVHYYYQEEEEEVEVVRLLYM